MSRGNRVRIFVDDNEPHGNVETEAGDRLRVDIKRIGVELTAGELPLALLEICGFRVDTLARPRLMISLDGQLVEIAELRTAAGDVLTRDDLVGARVDETATKKRKA